jgi:protein O-GlcNAc transferase
VIAPAAQPRPQRIAFDACPSCGGQDAAEIKKADCRRHPLYHPDLPPEIAWVACDSCGHVFTDGYLDAAGLALLFSGAHGNQLPDPNAGRGQLAAERAVAARMIDKVCAIRGLPAGRWLDVGIGAGALLATAQEYGFEVVGIDLRRAVVERMCALGFDVRCCELAELGAERFEVISFADVLEHIPFPKQALREAHRLLAEGGTLFVSMPDRESFLWKRLDALGDNPYWAELEHVHNFGRSGLYRMLAEEGFEPVQHGISERYVACMEVLATRRSGARDG